MDPEHSMDQVFIKKIIDILDANLENEQFGVKQLAKEKGISRSQLYRKLNALTGKSSSRFIREYRLKKAMEMLQKNVATASEISYRVGFNSPSYFNACFHNYYGYPPGEVKFREVSVPETSEEKEILAPENTLGKLNQTGQSEKVYSRRRTVLFSSSIVVLLLVISYLIYINFTDPTTTKTLALNDKSIAILPPKNLSNDKENQYFAYGIMESVQNHLNKIKDLKVISGTTMERYRETKKTAPEIAKEVGVSYLLESSAQKHGDSIRIIVQFIDAHSDHQLWSQDFKRKFKNIFSIQSDIAKQIAEELKITLSAVEIEQIEKIPTINIEAYQFYLKALSVSDNRSEMGLLKSIELYQQALYLDPNYADAYAGMANSYLLLQYEYLKYDDVIKTINTLVERALEINPNTVRAYTVKADLDRREGKWESAEENFKKALDLNPNDAVAHHHYSNFLNQKPVKELKKREEHIDMALKLDPLSGPINSSKFRVLIDTRKFEEAESHYNKMSFLFSEEEKIEFKIILKGLQNKNWLETFKVFQQAIIENPDEPFLFRELGYAYDEILNDDKNWAEKSRIAYQMDSTNTTNANSYFESLLEYKKFKEAERLLQSNNFKELLSEKQELECLFYYYYHKEDYKKAQKILNKKLFDEAYFEKLINLAQLGEENDVYQILKDQNISISEKAFVFAILEERDSMYHYLGQEGIRSKFVNSRREFNTYRKDDRYKAFLKKNYLPVTYWNE